MQTLTFLSRLSLVTLVGFIFSVSASTQNVSAQSSSTELIWQLSYQQETSAGSGRFHRLQKPATWQAKQTAIIVCDMWDLHHCHRAVLRGGELAPRLNAVLEEARSRGVTIIHAPSSCMDAYANHPARVRAQAVSIVSPLPEKITEWCYKIPAEEQGTYPIDQSNGGEDDEAEEHAQWAAHLTSLGRNPKAPWKSQMKEITIHDDVDYISDRGDEIWSILQSRGIEHVILTGVHVNMCVLGRPFGLRQLVRAGKDAVLMRDMTDTMYDPNCKPFVSHFTGTDLIIDHIERHVCPTISSNQLIGGQEFRFKDDKRPTVAILMAEDEYKTETTLPPWSINQLGKKYRLRWIFGSDEKRYHIPGIEAVKDADLLIVSARRRPLPAEELAVVRAFAEAANRCSASALPATLFRFEQAVNRAPSHGLNLIERSGVVVTRTTTVTT